jgi:hypothetical protein
MPFRQEIFQRSAPLLFLAFMWLRNPSAAFHLLC